MNEYYWRRLPVRMESQVIRDSLLHLAGELDQTFGGPSVDAKSGSRRRSLYFKHSRDDQNEFLSMFDDADILRCYRRSESVVPQQALAMANSQLALSMARTITARLEQQNPHMTDAEFVLAAFETILCTQPTQQEAELCLHAIEETRALPSQTDSDQTTSRARQNLVHALINHNDFVTVR